MITTKQGNVHIEGCKPEVEADFAIIAKVLMDEKVLTAEELQEAIEVAQKSDEELSEKTKSVIKQFGEELAEAIKELFGEA